MKTGTQSCKIVMIDDEEWFLELCREAIQMWFSNLDLRAFQNRTLAWQHLQYVDPDLLLTDLNHDNVPGRENDLGFNGWHMLKLLRKRKVKYPILVVSGSLSNHGYKDSAREFAGPDLNLSFLVKPFTIEQLHAALFRHFGSTNMKAEV